MTIWQDIQALVDRELCEAIVASRQVAPSLESLASLLSVAESALEARIIASYDAGEVEPWYSDEPRLTLSPIGASRLGVMIGENGEYWLNVGKRGKASIDGRVGNRRVKGEGSTGLVMEWMESGEPTGLDRLIAAEEKAAKSREISEGDWIRKPADYVPLPTVLLGERLTWPVALLPTGGCPACMGKPRANEYCLVCDRYGREWMLPPVSQARLRQLRPKEGPRQSRKLRRAGLTRSSG